MDKILAYLLVSVANRVRRPFLSKLVIRKTRDPGFNEQVGTVLVTFFHCNAQTAAATVGNNRERQ